MINKCKGFFRFYTDKTIFNIKSYYRDIRKRNIADAIERGDRRTLLLYCFLIIPLIIDVLLMNENILNGLNINIFWPKVPLCNVFISFIFIFVLDVLITSKRYLHILNGRQKLITKEKLAYWELLSDMRVFNIFPKKVEEKRKKYWIPSISMMLSTIISISICIAFYMLWMRYYDEYSIIERKLIGNIFLWSFCLLYITMARLFAVLFKFKY